MTSLTCVLVVLHWKRTHTSLVIQEQRRFESSAINFHRRTGETLKAVFSDFFVFCVGLLYKISVENNLRPFAKLRFKVAQQTP